MKIISSTLFSVLLLGSTPLLAGNLDTDALLGGALGGAVGGAVGSELGGRNGAIVGSAIGGAAGTAFATRNREPKREVIEVHAPHDNGRHLGHYKQKRKHHHDD
jgi:outer membrane lipoprotein SlyB